MLSNRLSIISPSCTIGISSKVKKMRESGKDVISLSIGEPDFNVPKKALECGVQSLNENCTKYDLVPGLTILRDEICKKLLQENNSCYSSDEIVLSSGAKNAITNALLVVTDPGDEVLIPKPYWVSYSEMTKLVNAVPVPIETHKSNDFKLTADLLEKYITDKTKMLLLNNPSNPTGSVYTKEELLEIANVCLEKNIYILSDEIYERICYNDKFVSVASLGEDVKNITITVNGFAKSAAMTGLRLGYTASNEEIAQGISAIQGHLVSHPSLTAQYIGYGALKHCKDDIDNMVNTYRSRRNLITSKLDTMKYVDYVYPNGAFYVFIDLSQVSKKYKYNESFSIEFCDEFLSKYNVAIVPGKAFGIDEYVRISYACSEKEFLEGLNRLENFILEIMN
ncbi:pyridoxal phosphate-dependent aminotransferase [Terrisporobacter mayombei]|uniref:Aminotransferase n=1 Tax=Terrisporobacter mayombei TaxID=1541 RepID=A0ABY9Q357_9FIRM|nr:pyridoxal phosphate-dependent aminotransferase [Terrisporobacter mayombei]MCC3870412.1 pyridoxal phosphate-dependent aminotransferase [Terrisporobacter mayombei]WMT82415.1 Aspartate aminotransferase [Terrisporobacter mayombei]